MRTYNFTQGDWRAEIHGSDLLIFSDGGTPQFPYSAVITSINLWDIRECKANARLLSASPDMHKALTEIVNWFIAQGYDRELPEFRQAQLALIKANKSRIKGDNATLIKHHREVLHKLKVQTSKRSCQPDSRELLNDGEKPSDLDSSTSGKE